MSLASSLLLCCLLSTVLTIRPGVEQIVAVEGRERGGGGGGGVRDDGSETSLPSGCLYHHHHHHRHVHYQQQSSPSGPVERSLSWWKEEERGGGGEGLIEAGFDSLRMSISSSSSLSYLLSSTVLAIRPGVEQLVVNERGRGAMEVGIISLEYVLIIIIIVMFIITNSPHHQAW